MLFEMLAEALDALVEALPWWARFLLVLGVIGAVVVYMRTPPETHSARTQRVVVVDAGAHDGDNSH